MVPRKPPFLAVFGAKKQKKSAVIRLLQKPHTICCPTSYNWGLFLLTYVHKLKLARYGAFSRHGPP
jgi:hypothetical protein